MGRADPDVAELSVSDHAQLGPLADYLHLALPDVRVGRSPGRPRRGEQGALDVLTIAAESSVLTAVVQALSSFLRSRKPSLTVTVTVKRKRKHTTVTATATDAREAAAVVRELLDE